MPQPSHLITVTRAAAVTSALLLSMSAAADQATYLSNQASYCEIFQAINPDVPDECRAELEDKAFEGGKTRSIQIHKAKQAVDAVSQANAATDGQVEEDEGPRAIAMNIQFDFELLAPDA